ncbi:MAG TPA: hypothetical protein VFZ81_06055, partial [Burkholderiales bacterium]
RKLREGSEEDLLESLIRPESRTQWLKSHADSGALERRVDARDLHIDTYRGFLVYGDGRGYYAHLALDRHRGRTGKYTRYFEAKDLPGLRAAIDAVTSAKAALGLRLARAFVPVALATEHLLRRTRRAMRAFRRAGGGGPGPGVPVAERAKQFLAESELTGDALGDLAQNLCFLSGAVTVLADSPRTIIFLRMLKALGIAPRANLVCVERAEDVVELLRQNACSIVLTRQLYWRCCTLLGSRLSGERLAIV